MDKPRHVAVEGAGSSRAFAWHRERFEVETVHLEDPSGRAVASLRTARPIARRVGGHG
jgi:hypothetical protein